MAIDDGKDITKAPPRHARSLRDVRSDWVESVCRTLSRATLGEAVRVGRKQIPAASRVSLVLKELAHLWRSVPPRSEQTKARRLNKEGPVGFPPEPSGLEAIAGATAAVLWAAQLTRENRMVPEQLSRALQRPIAIGKTGIPKAEAAAFLALLHRSLDRKVLAKARAQALHEATHLPDRVEFGPLPNLSPWPRLWFVTLARLLKEDPDSVCHKAISNAAGKSIWWSTKMPPHLELAGLIPRRPARGKVVWALTPKGRAWIAKHEPALA